MMRKLADRFTFAALPVALAAGLAVAGSPAPTAAPAVGLTLDGHFIDDVLVDGTRMVSYAEYTAVAREATANRSFLELHIDGSSIERGHFVAFTTPEGSREFQAKHGLVADETNLVNSPREAVTVAKTHTLNGDEISLVACDPFASNGARMFDGLNCTDSYISMWTVEKIYNFGSYGWNDRISSAAVGSCIYMLKMFEHADFLGASQILYGPDRYLTGLTLGNRVSSATTPGTRC